MQGSIRSYALLALCAMLSALCGACASHPFERWTPLNTTLQVTGTALQVVDWSQTRWISAHGGDGWREFNPIIGNTPTDSEVNAYFLASALGRTGVAAMLRDPYRTWAQSFFIITSGGLVGHNIQAGVGLKW